MNQPSQPTAAELGVSEAEYERILHGLRLRQGDGAPVAPSERPHRSKWRLILGVGFVVAAGLLLRQLAGDAEDPEPV